MIRDCHAMIVIIAMLGMDILEQDGDYRLAPLRLISFIRTKKLVGKGYHNFLAHFWDSSTKVSPIASILIVCKILEVFPDDLSCMPLDFFT